MNPRLDLISSPLAAFLQQPDIEEAPAWEFINGDAHQKPMPSLYHSRLQRNLVNWINQQTSAYEAIPELRCLVPPISPVPDIAVIAQERLPQEDGPFAGAPDWFIEIRSSSQNILALQAKILHCLAQGTALAWLIDLQRQQVWAWQSHELPLVYRDQDILPSLNPIPGLSVAEVMALAQQR